MATIHNPQLAVFLTDVSLYDKHPQRAALKKIILLRWRDTRAVVGASKAALSGASFPSILHGGSLTPDKSNGEWLDLAIYYLCVAGA